MVTKREYNDVEGTLSYAPKDFQDWLSLNLDRYRDENGRRISPAELARKVGFSSSYIAQLLGGKERSASDRPKQPSREAVRLFANALKVDVNEALLVSGYAPGGEVIVFREDGVPIIMKDGSVIIGAKPEQIERLQAQLRRDAELFLRQSATIGKVSGFLEEMEGED